MPNRIIATKQEPRVHQLDGADDYSLSFSKRFVKQNKKTLLKKVVLQLDGGGPGMSDSSSEEEDEDDDPLQRYAGLEDDKIDPDVGFLIYN